MMHSLLFSFFLVVSSSQLMARAGSSSGGGDYGGHLNATCMADKFDRLATNVERKFKSLYGGRLLLDARIERVDDHHNMELMALWRQADPETGEVSAFKQTIAVNGKNRPVTGENSEEEISDVLFFDQIVEKKLEAKLLHYPDEEENYLTIVSNGSTSCSYKLSAKVKHGDVFRDPNWGFFRLSPDGKYLAYTAHEEKETPYSKFLARRRNAGGVTRPIIVIYEIETEQFRKLDWVPKEFSLGQLQWHPDSQNLVGVAWNNHPVLAGFGFPRSANVDNVLFTLDVVKMEFAQLTKPGSHVDSPRLSEDGATLVYLENCLHSSTFKKFYPGTYEISRRLVTVSWADVVACTKQKATIEDKKRIVVSNSQMANVTHPQVLPDGSTFYGLYPWESPERGLLPDRIFSADGSTVYMSVIQMADVLLMAVHLQSGQITLFKSPGYQLLDVYKDVILVQHSKLNLTPTIRIGRLHDDYFPTTTTTTTSTTTPTPTTTTTQSPTTKKVETTTDPCIKNANNSNPANSDDGNSSHPIAVGKPEPSVPEPVVVTAEPAPTTTEMTTTTQHPHATPLRLAKVYFRALTAPGLRFYKEKRLVFEKPDYKESTCPQSFFTAVYSYPKGFPPMPLVVLIHGGPHRSQVRTFNRERSSYLDMGMAVLEVNYRGSTGMGDESLQAIVGNVGEMAVSDVHQATQFVLKYQMELRPRVALVGHSYGGFIAATLAAKHPDKYRVLSLQSAWLDGSATRTLDPYLFSMRGMNRTEKSRVDKEMITYYYDRSPISRLPSIKANTLFITGAKDTLTHPGVQSLPFQRGLMARGVRTDHLSLPGEGHSFHNEQSQRAVMHRTQSWLHENWGTYENECALYEMTTDGLGRPVTTPPPESSTTTSALTAAAGLRTGGEMAVTLVAAFSLWALLAR